MNRRKKLISFISMLMLFVVYYLATDPDSNIFSNLPFGSDLILTLNIFIIGIMSILVVEFVPDFFIDEIYGKEDEVREHAVKTPEGAAMVLIAKSIRIFAYAIIITGSIIAYNLGG